MDNDIYYDLKEARIKISHYQKLLLEARDFVIDAYGSWETMQGEHLVSEIDKLIEWDKKGIPHFKDA